MYQTINESEFRSAFHSMGRGQQFSYEGLTIIYEALEQFEQDTGEDMELDVLALCCDYSEMTEKEIRDTYGDMIEDEDNVEEFLQDNTWLLGSHEADGVKQYIYQQF